VIGPRHLENPVGDDGAQVVMWPDHPAMHLDRPTEADPARQPVLPAAGSCPSGDTSHHDGPGGRHRHWRLPATGPSVTAVRRGLDDFLRDADLSDDERYDLLLAACEATSNAIEHARNPTEPFVEVLAEMGDARVTITICDSGRWRDAIPGTDRGRGLRMMWLLADTTVSAGRHGTTVTIRSSPRHARHPVAAYAEPGAAHGSRMSCPRTG
jgi:anti-sigma regulatory factor (Ser/Thr protein kinase)